MTLFGLRLLAPTAVEAVEISICVTLIASTCLTSVILDILAICLKIKCTLHQSSQEIGLLIHLMQTLFYQEPAASAAQRAKNHIFIQKKFS